MRSAAATFFRTSARAWAKACFVSLHNIAYGSLGGTIALLFLSLLLFGEKASASRLCVPGLGSSFKIEGVLLQFASSGLGPRVNYGMFVHAQAIIPSPSWNNPAPRNKEEFAEKIFGFNRGSQRCDKNHGLSSAD